ncbi:ITPKA [Cordylochernes scorpioides]|uniref:ITPKA n=1 Tax=Cordylochernes scorpioides TaxID=51811 RepID=A0ABY6LQK1_9ARAC|nr:ITPKA [Cordylochernes scorpioides]
MELGIALGINGMAYLECEIGFSEPMPTSLTDSSSIAFLIANGTGLAFKNTGTELENLGLKCSLVLNIVNLKPKISTPFNSTTTTALLGHFRHGLTIPSCNYLTERRRTSLGSLSSSPCSSPHTPEGTVSPDCLPWTDKEVMPPPMPPHRGLSIPPTTVSLSPSLAHHASCPNIIISDFCDPGSTPSPTPEDYGYFSYTRSLSTCSSTTSSMSWDEDLTDAPKLPKKVSKWKKIRNAIHWSPFVQTYHKYKYPWVQLAGHQGVGIGLTAINTIINNHLKYRKLVSRWVPHRLTKDQKPGHVKC